MKDIFFCISKKHILNTGSLSLIKSNGGYLCFSENRFENDKYVVLLYGDIYETAPYHEIIIKNYELHAEQMFSEINGDFGIILYDKKCGCFIAGRDKFGVKSLYYYKDENTVAVSNRIHSFFKYLPIRKIPNERKNLLYVGSHYRHIDAIAEDTFYSGITAIKQGHYIKSEKDSLTSSPYWRLEILDLSRKTRQDIENEYLSILRNSIRRRLLKSTNPAFMVSSGMDSSGIAALASEILNDKVNLFTTVFAEDTEYNEAKEIEPVAAKIGKSWNKLTIDPRGIVEDVVGILKEADEPFYTVTQLMHYYLAKEVSTRGFDTLFGGLGGDEANCGEIEEYLFFFADLKLLGEESLMVEHMRGWVKYHGHPLYPKSYDTAHEYFKKHINFGLHGESLLDLDRYNKYFFVFNRDYADSHYITPKLEHPYKSYLLNKLYQDLYSEVIPCVLKAEEFNLNKFRLKGRMPYFDSNVMQYGFSIPILMKYKNGCNKAVLREAMKWILPDSTINNCMKKGWNAPFNEWLKVFLKDKAIEMLNNSTQRQKAIYNIGEIKKLLQEHLTGICNHMMFFWQFLNYEMWYNINIDR
ncbi:MAG: hypothetical protein HQK96_20595 [Nitrospirae bacterium]|nr:hypothetical protein [Nitrospirota bacterium]